MRTILAVLFLSGLLFEVALGTEQFTIHGPDLAGPGDDVVIAVEATTDVPTKAYSVHFEFDPAVFDFVSQTVEGTLGDGAYNTTYGNTESSVSVGVIFSLNCPPSIPPGTGPVLYATLRVRAGAPHGTTVIDLVDATPELNRLTDCSNATSTPTLIDESIFIDIVPPEVSGGQADPPSGEAGTVFTLSCLIADTDAGVDQTTVEAQIEHPDEAAIAMIALFDDGVNGGDLVAGDGAYTGQWDSSAQAEGTYYVDIAACDLVGNCDEAANEVTFLVGTPSQDTDPPEIVDVGVEPGSGPSGTLFTLSAAVTDLESGVDPLSVEAEIERIDGNIIAVVQLFDDGIHGQDPIGGDGVYTGQWDSSGQQEGGYLVDVLACDLADPANCGEEDNAANLTITDDPSVITVCQNGCDYSTINEAIQAAATGMTIELRDALYTGPGNRNVSFAGKGITVRSASGDPESCVIDCQSAGNAFIFNNNEGPDAVLEGMTIINGAGEHGGAVHCHLASPTLRKLVFADNVATLSSGALYLWGSYAAVSDVVFRDNTASYGGAIYFTQGGAPTVTNALFDGNTASQTGGAVMCYSTAVTLTEVTFADNIAGRGGAVYCHVMGEPTLRNCTLDGNAALSGEGGGVYVNGTSLPTVENTIISYSTQGEAIYVESRSTPILRCCNIFGNAGGDWVGSIQPQYGLDGNISEDPWFCGQANPEDPYSLTIDSPCAPDENPVECGLIGAHDVGCGEYCTIELLWPNGGEEFCAGDLVVIEWDYRLTCADEVVIELLHNDESCLLIDGAAPNTGSYSWQSEPCGSWDGLRIRISDPYQMISDESDGSFHFGPPLGEVVYPNGGEVVTIDDDMEILWEPGVCSAGNVMIELLHGGAVCDTIVESTANDGAYIWSVRACGDETGGYAVRITDRDIGISDSSDGLFEILPVFLIQSIVDVGNDQGRNVRITWHRSEYDEEGEPEITGYSVYRKEQQYFWSGGETVSRGDSGTALESLDGRDLRKSAFDRLDGWDFLTTVPAHGDETYQYVAPTLCDSTLENGICWSHFFIRAITPDPLEYFDTSPDSGYSVDNLEPSIPEGLEWTMDWPTVSLVWEPIDDEDFRCFVVYRSEEPVFEPSVENRVGYAIEPSFVDNLDGEPRDVYYIVTAMDFAGNESQSEPVVVDVAEGQTVRPTVFTLHQSRPNPFTGTTRISFDLPEEMAVNLRVFDVSGRAVATLVETRMSPGAHSVIWDGRDDEGRLVQTGVYLCRLRAGALEEHRKMILAR